MGRHLLVGDIHGCLDELRELLDMAGLGEDDRLIAVGDAVDRGPNTPGVLALLAELPNTRCIKGNHERKHIGYFRGYVEPAISQLISRRQFGEQAYPNAVAEMAAMPELLELPEVTVIHGMWEPGKPAAEQDSRCLCGTLGGEFHLRKNYPKPWYELYDGPKPLVVGHHDYLGGCADPLVIEDRVFGIDTGCCRGGRLTGLLLPEWRFLQVPARENHWERAQRDYADAQLLVTPAEDLPWEQLELCEQAITARGAEDAIARQTLEQVRATRAEGERALEEYWAMIEAKHREIVESFGGEEAFLATPEFERGRRYAAHVKGSREAPFLHRLRKDRLDEVYLRKYVSTPREASSRVSGEADQAQ